MHARKDSVHSSVVTGFLRVSHVDTFVRAVYVILWLKLHGSKDAIRAMV